jgi:hypothetical protein
MANCTDCAKYTYCPDVEDKEIDVFAEGKEMNCDNFERGE